MPKGHSPTALPSRAAVPRAARPEPVITFDDPEDEEWFQRLPADAKDDIRRRWAAGEARGLRRVTFAKVTRARSMAQGAAVFFLTETCCAIPSWGHTAVAIVVGAGVGALWHAISANRFRCMVSSVMPYAALRVAFPSDSPAATAIFAVLGFVMLCGLAAAAGFVRERRRADDLDY